MTEGAGEALKPASVTILLVVKNGRAYLEESLPLITGQDYEGAVEYVCIDSGSTDGTVALLTQQGITVHEIPPEEFHHGRTRNLAAAMATNEILVCLSQDVLPVDKQWLRHLIEPFSDPQVGGVYGRQIAPEGMGARRRQSLASEYPETRQDRDPECIKAYTPGHFRFSNANGAVRRRCWEHFRWDETVLLAEDQGFCRDLLLGGWKVVYTPDAAVIHGHERSLWGEFQYALDNGLSLARLGILNNPEIGGELRYGLKRMATDLTHFAKRGRVDCVAASLVSFGLRYLGVQVGKRADRLPTWLLRALSETHRKLGR